MNDTLLDSARWHEHAVRGAQWLYYSPPPPETNAAALASLYLIAALLSVAMGAVFAYGLIKYIQRKQRRK